MGQRMVMMTGRMVAIGDVHGCASALTSLLELVRLQPEDLLIPLGDYVDRGPDSRKVLDLLMHLHGQCTVYPLKGNHEEMMLEARSNTLAERMWRSCGGTATLQSYVSTAESGRITDIPESHWTFLERCKDYLETETHFFVHANAKPDLQLAEQDNISLRWTHLEWGQQAHCSGKVMVCGHTPQEEGLPLVLDHLVCIDTAVFGGGWLTAYDVGHGIFYQTTTGGASRMLRISDLLPPAQ